MQDSNLQHLVWAINTVVEAANAKCNQILQSDSADKELKIQKIMDILQDVTKKSSTVQSTTINGIALGTTFYLFAIKNV